MKNLNASKTRANSALRKQLMQMGNIKPAPKVPALQQLERSHVEAIIARRKELGKA